MAKTQHSVSLVTELERFLKRSCSGLFDIRYLNLMSSGNVYTIGPCGGFAISFSGKNSLRENILPFFIKEETDGNKIIYYLGIMLSFPTEGKRAEPSLVSLRFFAGERTEDISLIFRAEFQKDSKEEHSQPHWHFQFVEEKEKVADNFEEFDLKSLQSFNGGTRYPEINHMHFCMSWNTKGHSMDLTGNMLQWISETIAYVQSQLSYIHKRHSAIS